MKKIYLKIDKCYQCPYCEYDPHYDMTMNSGFNCTETNKRIKSDDKKIMADLTYTPIPEWCPLEDDN